MIKVGITGCKGRMGQSLIREVESADDLEFAGGIDQGDDAQPLFEKSDIVIDFTRPEATINHAALAAQTGTALIIGTTGLDDAQEQKLKEAAEKTAIIYAANMSVGVNMLLALVEQAASRLGIDWDIEVFETHHNQKIDSPSGTALALGKAARAGRKGGDFVTDRTGKRKSGDIGYAVQRGGDVVGEHDVTFFSQGERITLGHKATDRSLFAKGAIHAVRWANGKDAGLYSMKDVLDL
jgi:4-hydroxy-tetrahydrodipicolinate reductase